MSTLNADEARGASLYLRTKGEGENLAHTLGKPDIAVTSFRPSIVFGPGDGFFNRFAPLLKAAPFVFPLPCANARFAPVYVGDVVAAMVKTLDERSSFARHYELCGPRSYTFKALMELTCRTLGIRRWIVDVGDHLSRLQARVFGSLPGKLFTRDNYLSLSVDSLCRQDGLRQLGIEPVSVEAMVARYLVGGGARQRYRDFRAHAEHRG
jgi:NADH dehydrogenase